MNYIIKLTDKDLTAKVDSGMPIDVLAKSIGQYDSNEMYAACIDSEHYSIDYVLENFDYESYIIKYTNANPVMLDDIIVDRNAVPYKSFESAYKESKTNLLAGAWLALEYPKAFEEFIANKTDELKELAYNYHDVNYVEDFGGELCEQVEKAFEEYSENNHKEWLHGDYSNFAGILKLAEREYGATDVTTEQGDVIFDFDEDEVKNFLNEVDEDIKVNAKNLKTELADYINRKANAVMAKESEKRTKRDEEYAKTKAYQDERKAQAEADRIEKLQQMVKN